MTPKTPMLSTVDHRRAVLDLAVRDGLLVRSPVDLLTDAERASRKRLPKAICERFEVSVPETHSTRPR